MADLPNLNMRRLPEIVENSITDYILTENLKAGQKLPKERDMAKQLGVSTMTVREALRGLEVFGIIEKRRGKAGGIYITDSNNSFNNILHNFFKLKSLSSKNLHQVRQIVEPAAAGIAATCITKQELSTLEENIRYCDRKLEGASVKTPEKDFFDIEDKNLEFHALISEATHNPLLILITNYIMYFLISYKKNLLLPDLSFARATFGGHKKILDLLRKRDVRGVEEVMKIHIQASEDYFKLQEKS